MALKRPFTEGSDDDTQASVQHSKRQLTLQKSVGAVLQGLSPEDFAIKFEPLIRKTVREEVERVVQRHLQPSQRPSLPKVPSYGPRCLQLQFLNQVPPTIFTNNRVETKESTPLKVVIVDACSQCIMASGPFSSIKVEILVLDGDFGADGEVWGEEEFDTSIIRERDGKRPLLTGELTITLRDGIGYLTDITFTDNSSWTRSRTFRLGVKPLQSASIREARSGAFVVKDHRGELYKKHHPPSLTDEIWRLEKIAKDGKFHKRLEAHGIKTVEDFLRRYNSNPFFLRDLLGGVNSTKIWNTLIEHASACIIDDHKLYIYCSDAQEVTLVFNSVYKAVGAIVDGSLQPLDQLTLSQKNMVKLLKEEAFRNVNNLVPLDPSIIYCPSHSFGLQAHPFSLCLCPEQPEFPVAGEGQYGTLLTSDPSPPESFELEGSCQAEASAPQNSNLVQVVAQTTENSFMLDDSSSGHYTGGVGWFPHASAPPHEEASSWYPPPGEALGQGCNSFLDSTSTADIAIFSPLPNFSLQFSTCGKPRARWCKIRAAVKWVILVRREVAARRMASILLVG